MPCRFICFFLATGLAQPLVKKAGVKKIAPGRKESSACPHLLCRAPRPPARPCWRRCWRWSPSRWPRPAPHRSHLQRLTACLKGVDLLRRHIDGRSVNVSVKMLDATVANLPSTLLTLKLSVYSSYLVFKYIDARKFGGPAFWNCVRFYFRKLFSKVGPG